MKYEDKGLLVNNPRRAEYEVNPLFINRWSPRLLDRSPIDRATLNSIFEAARWSMSCNNSQSWRFLYAVTEEDRKAYLKLLTEGNQTWAKEAPVLGFIFAKRRFDHNDKPNRWAGFDSGAAWMAMTLQARMLGLYTHGMAGFHADKVYQALDVPEEDYEVCCAFAIGQFGDIESLPPDKKEMERPNNRHPFETIVKEGKFK